MRNLLHDNLLTPFKPRQLADMLRDTFKVIDREFWSDELSLLDETVFAHSRIDGSQQLTNIYMLGLAVHRGGRIVTFDQRIPLCAVQGASAKHLHMI